MATPTVVVVTPSETPPDRPQPVLPPPEKSPGPVPAPPVYVPPPAS